MKNDLPLVSIITVVYNGEKTIEKTIQSVFSQKYKNIEYIIIDGCSTDNTVSIIQKYDSKISYWISEVDNGIYDAMNKGLKVAKGEYIAILNADDYYLPNAVPMSISKIQNSNSDYSFANVRYVNSDKVITPINPLKKGYIYQEMPYPHVSAFISKKIYDSVGFFNPKFSIAGDHDMALRIHLKEYTYCYVNCIVAELEMDGISSSFESNRESILVAVSNGKNALYAHLTYINQVLKVSIAKMMPSKILKIILKLKGSRFR